jgi:hypothetical protein
MSGNLHKNRGNNMHHLVLALEEKFIRRNPMGGDYHFHLGKFYLSKSIQLYGLVTTLNSVQFNLFCSRNPWLAIQPPDIEQANIKIVYTERMHLPETQHQH